ncbi:MAG TPA: hypothetical protein PLI95_12775, partial [Polyangiaceae bacterium]|nr:hypothetical protein [Polyangiaceae bacterium]
MPHDDSSSAMDEPLSSAESRNPVAESGAGAPAYDTASALEPAQGPARATMTAILNANYVAYRL